jgi:hypothetical protein
MTVKPTPDKALTWKKLSKSSDLARRFEEARQMRGLSTLRFALDILRRMVGPQKLTMFDYLDFWLQRPGLSEADRAAFVSESEITLLNRALRPDEDSSLSGLIKSKILTETLLRGAGIPTSQTVAVAQASRAPFPVPVLVGAAAIEAFLRDEGRLPLFGKPNGSSLGVGAASLMRLEGDDLVFGNGQRTPVARLAQEIARDYPDGFLFQKIVVPHPDLAALIGPVIGTLRVTSLWLKDGPAPLYTMLKMPGPGAMVDGQLSGSNGIALVDPATGRILRAQQVGRPLDEELTQNPITGATLPGAALPGFAEGLALALGTHRLFPGHGVLGSDVMLSATGPVINEVNLNPLSSLVQHARGCGLYDARNMAMYREAFAVQGVALPVRGVRLRP